MAEEGGEIMKKWIHTFLISIGILFILIGYCLMMTSNSEISTKDEVVLDYTNCTTPTSTGSDKCVNVLKASNATTCAPCLINLQLAKPLVGQVIIYYELTNYNQTSQDYINSKDDGQLNGNLSEVPSEKCEPYRYSDDKLPIVPCGLIANTMFDDVFTIDANYTTNPENVPIIEYGMLSDSDKVGFKNPERFDSTTFSNPKTWVRSINSLDTKHPDNNGFQNERFIGWMRTDWKRKPYGRLSHYGKLKNGLPVGDYRISFNFLRYDHYDGPRKLIFVATQTSVVPGPFDAGAVLVPIGMLVIVIVGALMYGPKILEVTHKKYDEIMASRSNGVVANPTSSGPPQPNPRTQPAAPLLKPTRANPDENRVSAI